MRFRELVLLMLVDGSFGCGPTGPECDLCTTSAIVYGSVTDSDGRPVAGAPIHVRVYVHTCVAADHRGGSDRMVPRTDIDGSYRADIVSLFQPFTAECFLIRLNPENDPRWPADSVERSGRLEIRSDYDSSARDSTRFDLIVSAR
jgi:hypothetical protein